MNVHEYQAKKILERYGVTVPPYGVASDLKEVELLIEKLKLDSAVVKVQVHAGGRGKAGGVKIAKNQSEILSAAKELIGMRIVNQQTGSVGVVAHQVLISPLEGIEKEYYLAAAIDRSLGRPIIIASPEGGMEIEEVAEKNPDAILKLPFRVDGTLYRFQQMRIAKFMGWEGDLLKQGMKMVAQLAKAFTETDAELLEINPLVKTPQGTLVALDAKLSVDENALYRQKEITEWYDPSQSSPNEVMAKEFDLAYVGLEGNIGCMVNGAGLAMATMDTIHHYGGEPANFLDVGGSASKEKVAHGFRIILLDPNVRAIFVNIFGGIMDCGVLAAGVVAASKEDHVSVPLIVRMEGTNVQEGKRILHESGLNIITADTMAEGALKAVDAAKRG